MKKCPYCGKEYTDDVERCLIDNELLTSGEAPPSNVEGTIAVSTPPTPSISETVSLISSPVPSLTDRQLRMIELVLVCLVAFGLSIIASSHLLLYGSSENSSPGSSGAGSYYRWIYYSAHEIPALGLLWYVLQRRGQRFTDLGLTWRLGDVWRSIILYVAGSYTFYFAYHAMFWAGLTAVTSGSAINHVDHILFVGGVSIATILFQVLNPFFEELIVRAYVMTEVRRLTNSATKAVIISTLLQTGYHFYQGVPMALAAGTTFLIYSVYYARSGRIAPIILAHLYSDVGATLFYHYWH